MEKVQPTGSTNQKVLFTETICTTVYTLYTSYYLYIVLVAGEELVVPDPTTLRWPSEILEIINRPTQYKS